MTERICCMCVSAGVKTEGNCGLKNSIKYTMKTIIKEIELHNTLPRRPCKYPPTNTMHDIQMSDGAKDSPVATEVRSKIAELLIINMLEHNK